MVTLPALFTASVAMPPKLFSTFMQSDRFNSVCVAMASARPLFVITLPAAFIAFAFMGAIGSGKLGGGVQLGVCEVGACLRV